MNKKNVLTINIRPKEGQREEWDTAFFWSCVFSILWLFCRFLTGFVTGFTVHYTLDKLYTVILTCLKISLSCLIREEIRSWLICFFRNRFKHPVLPGALLAISLGLLNFPLAPLSSSELWQILIGSISPDLLASVLLTMLAYYGGLLPPFLYSLATGMLPLLFPVAPGKLWLLELLIKCVLPLLFLIVLCLQYDAKTEARQAKQKKTSALRRVLMRMGEGLFVLTLAGCMAFFLGLLPWHPLAVATGSMEPQIQQGDMAVIADVKAEELTEGDVIQFRRANYTVLHRIVEIWENEDGTISYITRGDANNAPDEEPVDPEDVIGRVIGRIPGVGKITLWMRSQ